MYREVVDGCNSGSVDERLRCISQAIATLQNGMLPAAQPDIDTWPGNDACVSCHFAAGLLVSAVEVTLLYFAFSSHLQLLKRFSPYRRVKDDNAKPIEAPQSSKSVICKLFSILGGILSILGWFYWFAIFSTFWNFISWMLTSGLFVLAPGFISTLRRPKSGLRSAALARRKKLAGWVFGLICLIMFPNVARFPQQIYRRFNAAETVILPDDELVIGLRNEFFRTVTTPEHFFGKLTFIQQMEMVDEYIKDVIIWKSDYQQYGLVGLLTTAREVIERSAGDCQGQAVTTVSLLLSMGFQAWVVETPFHWWTHAWNNVTGESYNLNDHGSAGTQGSVNPQPIDLVYTRPPVACHNCSYVDAHNTPSTLYIAPPPLAFAIAMTGAHIFVRSSLTLETVDWWQMLEFGAALAVLVALYAAYFQGDKIFSFRFFIRWSLAAIFCVGPVFAGMCFWASVYYPVTLMHLIATITFVFTAISSNSFNSLIGSPILLP